MRSLPTFWMRRENRVAANEGADLVNELEAGLRPIQPPLSRNFSPLYLQAGGRICPSERNRHGISILRLGRAMAMPTLRPAAAKSL